MPFDVMRVSIVGSAAGGETWSINPVYTFGDFGQPTPTFEEMNAAAQAVADVAIPATLQSLMSAALSRTGARLEARAFNGALQVVGEATSAIPTPGTAGATKPYQTAVVFSTRTAVPGARGRGRLYWPALGSQMETSTLRWQPAQQNTALTQMAAYLQAIGDAMEAPLGFTGAGLVVWSRTSLSAAPVITLSAGDVFDTQRRRRDRAVESYVSTPF